MKIYRHTVIQNMKMTCILIFGGSGCNTNLTTKQENSLTAEDLLKKAAKSASTISYCEGYIAGFYDARITRDYGIPDWISCPPTDPSLKNLAVSTHQICACFLKWAKDHPEKIHYY